jgi:hypothetical protein
MSARKEPFFWCPDVARIGRVAERATYDALWRDAAAGTLRGEASSEYLRSGVAIPALLAARPDIRLIAMLRNPVQMVASLHSNLLLGSQEDVWDLEAAWRLQDRRRKGECMPPKCAEAGSLQYREVASIGDQLEWFYATVPPRQRHVVVYDDLLADPRAAYLRVLGFLGLADDGRTDFARVHVNRRMRHVWLRSLHRSLPRMLGRLHAPLRAAIRAIGVRPSAVVERVTIRPQKRRPLRPGFEAELIAAFLPQIEKVERLLDRDLSSWKSPAR